MSSLNSFSGRWIREVESYMRNLLTGESEDLRGMYGMLRYHMGWEDEQGQAESAPQGKRVRPLVVLMACLAAGDEPDCAIPAAAAVELLHNFSLIHDDIEDDSPTRRHRPTLWTWAGVPQAINAGDALFTISRLSLQGLSDRGLSAESVLRAQLIFDQTCLVLTEGQYLDMSFETRDEVTEAEYLSMIAGKTAALLAASAQLGAIAAGASEEVARHYRDFGYELGLSFQVQDDILGIWGDEALTGKSAASDLLTRKKTLPVLHALEQTGPDAEQLHSFYLSEQDITPADLPAVLDLLDTLRSREHAQRMAQHHANRALAALDTAQGTTEGTRLLRELALKLLGRDN